MTTGITGWKKEDGEVLYGAEITNLHQQQRGCGIISGGELTLNTPADMHVNVAAGICRSPGVAADDVVAAADITITDAHATLNRYDIIYYADEVTEWTYLAGTAAANAVVPSLPTDKTNVILIAIIRVRPATTTIQQQDIIDCRVVATSIVPETWRTDTITLPGISSAQSHKNSLPFLIERIRCYFDLGSQVDQSYAINLSLTATTSNPTAAFDGLQRFGLITLNGNILHFLHGTTGMWLNASIDASTYAGYCVPGRNVIQVYGAFFEEGVNTGSYTWYYYFGGSITVKHRASATPVATTEVATY